MFFRNKDLNYKMNQSILSLCIFLQFSSALGIAQDKQSHDFVNSELGSGESTDYKLVWEDLFNHSMLDETNSWTIEENGNGGGNGELQYYRHHNVSIGIDSLTQNSCLIITGKKENFSGKAFTSGRLTTVGKKTFQYGKVEASIKLPKTANGLWPAFWLLGQDYATSGWPRCGEIDILEMGNIDGIIAGTQQTYFNGACHWGESASAGLYQNYVKSSNAAYSLQDDFHLYTLIWDETHIKMYLDLDRHPNASPYYELDISKFNSTSNSGHYFHKQFFIIFNLAIGGNFTQIWDANQISSLSNGDVKMYVNFVKVYQKQAEIKQFKSICCFKK